MIKDIRRLIFIGAGICIFLPDIGLLAQEPLEGPGFEVDFQTVELETEHVSGQVHVIYGAGGNIGVFAGSDGVFLVDDQFAPLTSKLLSEIAHISPQPIRFVINTHFHEDHTGANENLGRAGIVIIAHQNTREILSTPHFIEMINTRFPAMKESGLPVISFNNAVTFHINEERVDVFHLPPSHTDGDTAVFFRGSNVIHMGDVFRSRGYPIFDRNNGGSFLGLIKASNLVLSVIGEDTKIIPGHGVVSNRTDLVNTRDILIEIRNRIMAAIEEGQSLNATVAQQPLGDIAESWSFGVPLSEDEIVEWVYEELKAADK